MSRFTLLLLRIILLGALLRTALISFLPPSLNWDEVSLGYNSYSLLYSGQDEWGVTFPTIFRAFGDYKLPSYIYLTTVPVALGGLNLITTRATSIIAGILLIPVSSLLALSITKNKTASLLTAVLIAISPWTVLLSRISLEANLSILLVSLGALLFLKSRFFLSFFFFGLSVWTYNSARVFVPLLILTSVVIFIRRNRYGFLPLLTLLIFLVPMLIQLLSPTGQARFRWLNIIDSGAVAKIESQRNTSDLPQIMSKIAYNRVSYFASSFVINYLKHFSPDFLFISGGSHYQFNIPGFGLLYWINLPFFYLGLILLFMSKSKYLKFLLVWLILAPIPGSLTRDAPHTLRAITMVPPTIMASALGFTYIRHKLTNKKIYYRVVSAAYFLILFTSMEYYLTTRLVQYRQDYSWSYQYGYEQTVNIIKENYGQVDQIVFSKKHGEPHEYILFHWPWDPRKFRTDTNLNRYFRSDWYWVDGFDKFIFVNDWEMESTINNLTSGRILIVSSPDHPYKQGLIEQVDYLDGKPAFYISKIEI